jgi:hypothetical protein
MLPTHLPHPEQSPSGQPVGSATEPWHRALKTALIPAAVLLYIIRSCLANADVVKTTRPAAESDPCQQCFAITFEPERYCDDVRDELGLSDVPPPRSASSRMSVSRGPDAERARGHFACSIPGPDFLPTDRLLPAGGLVLDEAEKQLRAEGIRVERLSAGTAERSPGLRFGDGKRIDGWLWLEDYESWGNQQLRIRIEERRQHSGDDS